MRRSIPDLFGDLELDGLLGLLLHDGCSGSNTTAIGDIANPQPYQITSAQFGVNGQVEQRQITYFVPKLQADPDGPYVDRLSRPTMVRIAIPDLSNESLMTPSPITEQAE